MEDLTITVVIAKRITLRDMRTDLKKKFDEENDKLKDAEGQCEVWLLKRSNELGIDQLKATGVGTAFRSIETKVSCGDWNVFHNWVLETGNLDALEKRVSRKFIQEYRKEEHDLPPGVNVFEEVVMNVRRSNSIKEEV